MSFRSCIAMFLAACFAGLAARAACDCLPVGGIAPGGGTVSEKTTDAGDAGLFIVIHVTGFDAGHPGGY